MIDTTEYSRIQIVRESKIDGTPYRAASVPVAPGHPFLKLLCKTLRVSA